MKALYTAILDRLVSQVPELKMIDFDLGQLLADPLPPLNYPAALLKVDVNDLVDLGARSQQGPALLTLTLVFRTFERTSSLVNPSNRAAGLAHLDVIEKVKWALHGLSGADFTAISHRATISADAPNLRAYPMIFDTLVTDTPPADQAVYIPWAPAGGVGAGPELCLEDEENNSLL